MAKPKASAEDIIFSNTFPVVGIGAPAGGLKAVKQFLQAVPAESGRKNYMGQSLQRDVRIAAGFDRYYRVDSTGSQYSDLGSVFISVRRSLKSMMVNRSGE